MRGLLTRDRNFYKKIFIISLPIVIQNFITSSLNIVDTVMIGKLGEDSIAGVGIANQYFFLLNIIIMGLFSGIGIFISQYWGTKDIKNIRKLTGLGIILALGTGGIFTVLALIFPDTIIGIFNIDSNVIALGSEYLIIVCISYVFTAISFNFGIASRCIEKTTVPMIASAIGLGVNTVLNYGLIFGNFNMPELGIKGAAIATVIARIIECVIIVMYVYLSKSPLAGNIKEFLGFDREFVNRVYKTVLPVLLNEACFGFGSVMYSIIYGRIGTSAIASIQIAQTVSNLFMVIIFGIASSSLVMVGNEVGRGNSDKASEFGVSSLLLGCIIGVFISILIIFTSSGIVNLYNVSQDVKFDAKAILYITALVMILRVYNIIAIVGVMRGGGDTKVSFYIEGFTMWVIGVPLALIGAFIFNIPVYLVYALCTFEEVAKAVLCYRRIKSKKWIINLIEKVA